MVHRVLLADDSASLRTMLRLSLELDQDCEVVAEAQDGAQAVELAQRHQPDLIILDDAMPVMSGLEALPGARRACPDARIVLFSGSSRQGLEAEARSAGADAVVVKSGATSRIIKELLGTT